MTDQNAPLGERYSAPDCYYSPLTPLLADASRELCKIARQHDLSLEQGVAVEAALRSAEFLYTVAERIAHGEPTDPQTCSDAMALTYRFVIGKLAELRWRCRVPVIPEAAHWQDRKWLTDEYGNLVGDTDDD